MDSIKIQIIAVSTFIIMDVLTGILGAIRTHTLNSTKMRDGFWHKFAYVIGLFLAGFLDWLTSMNFDLGLGVTHIFTAAVIFIVAIELTSIFENLKIMNPDISQNGFLDIFGRPTQPPKHASGKVNQNDTTRD